VPEKLKDFFDERIVREIADQLKSAYRPLDERAFVRECLSGLAELELTDRGRHIAAAMRRHLPQSFAEAVLVLVRSLGPELRTTEAFGMAPFRYLPHVFFVAAHGPDDFEAAMDAQYELTKRFSAEYSIRTFLAAHPKRTLERLRTWAADPNVHVRRLVSEGIRPRLPWAPRLPAFQADPRPVLELLELLKDDPERYVQRSVANNLNDIAKDHPDLAVEVCRRWSAGASEGRLWIVRHALRSLVKGGHRGALRSLGFGSRPRVVVGKARLAPRVVKLGSKLRFSFELANTSTRSQDLLVDYAVHFVKADGGTRPKVFKLRRVSIAPLTRLRLESTVSFETLTTRRPRPGRHRIEVLVNGIAHPLAVFQVRP
jgi:3-methyladenine DNA glycosylase AlkC